MLITVFLVLLRHFFGCVRAHKCFQTETKKLFNVRLLDVETELVCNQSSPCYLGTSAGGR